jgi:hypothetical protein
LNTVQVFDCGALWRQTSDLVALPLAEHNPLRQHIDERPCHCHSDVLSSWKESPEDARACFDLRRLTSSRYPGLQIVLCCRCWDEVAATVEIPLDSIVAGLFDTLAESLGMVVVPREVAA